MTNFIQRLITSLSLAIRRRYGTQRPGHLALNFWVESPTVECKPLPPHRSPYAQDVTPLDATALRAVRPYLVAHEQRQRRRELALAALGQDTPGPYWIHGLEVA